MASIELRDAKRELSSVIEELTHRRDGTWRPMAPSAHRKIAALVSDVRSQITVIDELLAEQPGDHA